MSIRIMSAVWDLADLSRDELLVMLALADFCDDNGVCWPGMQRIAEKARMTERGARGIVRRLQDRGFLTVEEGRGRNHSNRYRVVTNPERRSDYEAGKPEAKTRNVVPIYDGKPERDDIKPERHDTKTGTLVPPNHQEPSKNHGSGDARARDALIDRVCEEAGIDPSRNLSAEWFDSALSDYLNRWQSLGLSDREIAETVAEVMRSRRDPGPPSTPRYFEGAMARTAQRKHSPLPDVRQPERQRFSAAEFLKRSGS